MLHGLSTAVHRIERWVYANAAARIAASGFVTADIGKVAYQTDTGVYYRLTSATPTWAQLAPPSGVGALRYSWLTSTANVDPGSGNVSGDGATFDVCTLLRFSKTDGNGNSINPVLLAWVGVFSYIRISDPASPLNFVVYKIGGSTDHGTWLEIDASAIQSSLLHNGVFTNAMPIFVDFIPDVSPAFVQATQGTVTGTSDTVTGKMMGLAKLISLVRGGNVLIIISGDIFNSGGVGDGAQAQLRWGTGTAPTNGAAPAGSAAGGFVKYISSTTAGKVPFSLQAIVAAFVGTIWVDILLEAITGGTATIENLSISLLELP